MCFCFVGLPFFPSASWPLSFLSLFLFLRPCLIHARMPDWGRAFVHGHTFLHSWTHFLAFMDTLSCIHGHTFLHSWSGPMTLACCMELRSCPIFLLFSSCLLYDFSSWKGHLAKSKYIDNSSNVKRDQSCRDGYFAVHAKTVVSKKLLNWEKRPFSFHPT